MKRRSAASFSRLWVIYGNTTGHTLGSDHTGQSRELPSSLWYKTHFSRQWNCRSLRCSWSIACRRCSNYIFILDLTPGFIGLGKDNCKTRTETFMFWDWVRLILENWRYVMSSYSKTCENTSLVLVKNIWIQSSHNFAHATTVKLSWHVGICDLIGWLPIQSCWYMVIIPLCCKYAIVCYLQWKLSGINVIEIWFKIQVSLWEIC